jgi:selenide,water dikinase
MVTGASGRNWEAYGNEVRLAPNLSQLDQDLLSDPQTSGGLLVACAPETVAQVMEVFTRHGFAAATVVGELVARMPEGICLEVV